MLVRFTVPGTIVPWARAGARGAQRFTPKPVRDYEAVIRSLGADAMGGRPPVDFACDLRVLAVYPWPKSMAKWRRNDPVEQFKRTRPDGDNILKAVKDALNSIVYVDDAQVAKVLFTKVYGDHPGLTVEIRGLTKFDWPINPLEVEAA